MSCYNCCTGVSLTSQLLLTRGKHADSHGNKSEHRFALEFAIQRDSEQGHFQDVGHTPWEARGRVCPLVLWHRGPKGLSWLQPISSRDHPWSRPLLGRGHGPATPVPKHHLLSHVGPRASGRKRRYFHRH